MMMLNFDFVLRLLVAGILGAIIGLDREYRAKEAGYRTHFLVSLGSALIMIVSQYGFQEIIKESSVTLDPSRVAAQVVSGIGFIGAGTIIFQKQIVRGLTTAAGIWATAGIGLACRNVHHQHCRHPADSGRARTVEPYFQKHWHEKFRDNLFHFQQRDTAASVPAIQLQRLSGGVLQPGPASAGRVHQLSSDHGHQIQEKL